MQAEDYGDEVGSVEEIDEGSVVGRSGRRGSGSSRFGGSEVASHFTTKRILDIDRVVVLDVFEFTAELGVAHRDADEDREEQQAREEDDRVELMVPLEVHEDQRDDGRFDRGDEKRNDQVTRMPKVYVAGAHGDDRENEQRTPCAQVKAHGQYVRMMLAVIVCVIVLCVRSAHVASPVQPTR